MLVRSPLLQPRNLPVISVQLFLASGAILSFAASASSPQRRFLWSARSCDAWTIEKYDAMCSKDSSCDN